MDRRAGGPGVRGGYLRPSGIACGSFPQGGRPTLGSERSGDRGDSANLFSRRSGAWQGVPNDATERRPSHYRPQRRTNPRCARWRQAHPPSGNFGHAANRSSGAGYERSPLRIPGVNRECERPLPRRCSLSSTRPTVAGGDVIGTRRMHIPPSSEDSDGEAERPLT